MLSGGSAFGLDAASGVQAFLREAERGFSVGPDPRAHRSASHSLRSRQWRRQGLGPALTLSRDGLSGRGVCRKGLRARIGRSGPWHNRLRQAKAGLSGAVLAAHRRRFPAWPATRKQMLSLPGLAAVNAVGSVTIADTPHFWAAPFEQAGEFGGLGCPHPWPRACVAARLQIRGARTRQYDALRCGNRRGSHAPAMQAARDHGGRGHGAGDFSGFLFFRWGHRFRPCDGQNPSQRPANGAPLDRRGGSKLPDARHRQRRL